MLRLTWGMLWYIFFAVLAQAASEIIDKKYILTRMLAEPPVARTLVFVADQKK